MDTLSSSATSLLNRSAAFESNDVFNIVLLYRTEMMKNYKMSAHGSLEMHPERIINTSVRCKC